MAYLIYALSVNTLERSPLPENNSTVTRAINQPKAGNRGQEGGSGRQIVREMEKERRGGYCRVTGGQGQREEAKVEGAEERQGEIEEPRE